MVNSYNRSLKVSYMRRLTADAVDLFILILLTPVVALATGPGAYIFPILFMLYFVGLQALTKGRSVGKLLVRIQVEATARRFPLVVWLLIRYLLVLGPIWAIERFLVLSANKRPAEVWILFIAIVTLL